MLWRRDLTPKVWAPTVWGIPSNHPDRRIDDAIGTAGMLTVAQAKAAVRYARRKKPDQRYCIQRNDEHEPNIEESREGVRSDGTVAVVDDEEF